MDNMNSVTRENANNAAKLSDTSEKMLALAEQLSRTVNRLMEIIGKEKKNM